jgi:hypothetical protein
MVMRGPIHRSLTTAIALLGAVAVAAGCGSPDRATPPDTRGSSSASAEADRGGWHAGITATVFWVGEPASADNGGIANLASAWDDEWMAHFGGFDDPDDRHGGLPSFTPQENPFYVALPYNDFDDDGVRKVGAASTIPWASVGSWPVAVSMAKNQWVEIRGAGGRVFAQWEDVGPYLEDDDAYVFGGSRPANTVDTRAGIDLSPAVRDALHVADVSTVDWRFVDPASVIDGPWTKVITRSPVNWH